MQIIDGKALSEKIIAKYQGKGGVKLAIVQVGNNEASNIYVGKKKSKCEEVGVSCDIHKLIDITEQDLKNKIMELNNDSSVTGILLQLPIPRDFNCREIIDLIDVKKDVEGLTSYHLGQIFANKEKIIPCTPKGVLTMLEKYNIDLTGKNVCIVGYSDIVGKPLAALCSNRNATVTVCNIKTKDLKSHTLQADIIMTATGVVNLIKANMVKEGAVVIDIGIAKTENGIVGDVDFENVKGKCSFITPVPGGVGPMTVASIIENLYEL